MVSDYGRLRARSVWRIQSIPSVLRDKAVKSRVSSNKEVHWPTNGHTFNSAQASSDPSAIAESSLAMPPDGP